MTVAAVVKLGGAAITWKDTLETLNEPTLRACARAIARAVTLEEDRARRRARALLGEGEGGRRPRGKGIVVVHGAGSFGHFQARRYGVSKGCRGVARASTSTSTSTYTSTSTASVFDAMRDNPELLRGVAQTRQSVTRLNHLVTSALIAEGVPAVGMSPFGGGWFTSGGGGEVTAASAAAAALCVRTALAAGLVPVIHGGGSIAHPYRTPVGFAFF